MNLTGISQPSIESSQSLTVTASSSNTALIPNPTVTYTSPNTTGSLSFTPVGGTNGVATIIVTVNDGQSVNNLLIRTFTVTVNAAPVISDIADQMTNENTATGPIAFTISDVETPAASQEFIRQWLASNSDAVAAPPEFEINAATTSGFDPGHADCRRRSSRA